MSGLCGVLSTYGGDNDNNDDGCDNNDNGDNNLIPIVIVIVMVDPYSACAIGSGGLLIPQLER